MSRYKTRSTLDEQLEDALDFKIASLEKLTKLFQEQNQQQQLQQILSDQHRVSVVEPNPVSGAPSRCSTPGSPAEVGSTTLTSTSGVASATPGKSPLVPSKIPSSAPNSRDRSRTRRQRQQARQALVQQVDTNLQNALSNVAVANATVR